MLVTLPTTASRPPLPTAAGETGAPAPFGAVLETELQGSAAKGTASVSQSLSPTERKARHGTGDNSRDTTAAAASGSNSALTSSVLVPLAVAPASDPALPSASLSLPSTSAPLTSAEGDENVNALANIAARSAGFGAATTGATETTARAAGVQGGPRGGSGGATSSGVAGEAGSATETQQRLTSAATTNPTAGPARYGSGVTSPAGVAGADRARRGVTETSMRQLSTAHTASVAGVQVASLTAANVNSNAIATTVAGAGQNVSPASTPFASSGDAQPAAIPDAPAAGTSLPSADQPALGGDEASAEAGTNLFAALQDIYAGAPVREPETFPAVSRPADLAGAAAQADVAVAAPKPGRPADTVAAPADSAQNTAVVPFLTSAPAKPAPWNAGPDAAASQQIASPAGRRATTPKSGSVAAETHAAEAATPLRTATPLQPQRGIDSLTAESRGQLATPGQVATGSMNEERQGAASSTHGREASADGQDSTPPTSSISAHLAATMHLADPAAAASVAVPNSVGQSTDLQPTAPGSPAADASVPATPHTAAGEAVAATTTASSVTTARLMNTLSRSEMRVGVRSAEFGDVTIRTAYARDSLTAQISLGNAQLSSALAGHLSTVEQRLSQEHGLRASVTLDTQAAGSASGGAAGDRNAEGGSSAQGSSSGQQRRATEFSPDGAQPTGSAAGLRGAASPLGAPGPYTSTMGSPASARLDLHI